MELILLLWTMAGLKTERKDGQERGIVHISANENGQINYEELSKIVEKYKKRILCIMITNPNTKGIFETKFQEISKLIHSVGAFVYMDGANMNAIAGWVNLKQMGVDVVHNNLHKTWSIPHGGGGPGDAIVAVTEDLIPYLPGVQIRQKGRDFFIEKPQKTIGSFHRHFGNFAHKVRCLTYLFSLGKNGIKKMSSVAVLSARYLYKKLENHFAMLPKNNLPIMHEFIISLKEETFSKIMKKTNLTKDEIISSFGKLFLDFGFSYSYSSISGTFRNYD